MKYGIGLDCGISSVGFAAMELDENDEPRRIIKLGSRVFDKAENAKDGASLAAPRRAARSLRRRVRRHQHRLERIRLLIVTSGLLHEEELAHLFDGQLDDIYMLRTKALDATLTSTEFARVLIHLAQRRGFRSNRKSDATDKEAGKLLNAVSENQNRMQKNSWRTVGEMFYKDEAYAACKRNKGENYANTVSRDMVEDEIHKIFSAQRANASPYAGQDFEDAYTAIVLAQRSFDEGPGAGPANAPSPYAGNQIERMIGQCTLIPEEKRAAKATYSFQVFNLWQKINHIRIEAPQNTRALTGEERARIFEFCHKSPGTTYAKLRKLLELTDEERFNISYGFKERDEVEKKAKFDFLKAYHQVRKTLDKLSKGLISKLSNDTLDAIGYAFTAYKNDDDILAYLSQNETAAHELTHEMTAQLLTMPSFSGFGHISVKACQKLIPHLQQGMTYDKACEAAGIDFHGHNRGEKQKCLPSINPNDDENELNDITNPVVRRAVAQTIKVINTLIREMGESPSYINIELARELSKTFEERRDIETAQSKNAAKNAQAVAFLQENCRILSPTGQDILKYRLWIEQSEIDPYTQKKIRLEDAFGRNSLYDVDHIVPYSISFDDSFNNKVLTHQNENRTKGNRLPLAYMPTERQNDFKVWVMNHMKSNPKKRRNLLKEKISDNDIKGFRERNLNDTKYLSRVLYNYIRDHLAFADYKDRKNHVRAVNGAITSYMRKRWGIRKIRENGDLHHAADAAVIACVDEKMIQKVNRYSKMKELQYCDTPDGSAAFDEETGVVLSEFPQPYPHFRHELEARLLDSHELMQKALCKLPNYNWDEIQAAKPAFVSRMTNHKVTGQAHLDTIRSGKEPGCTITKTALSALKLDKNGEIQNYYNPDSDRLLYDALKARLQAFDGDGKKAFPPGFVLHKPKADGSDGPAVKKVKLIEKASLTVPVRSGNGVAANGNMVRIDVFYVPNDGYYFVPIYVSDTVKPELPNRACVAAKPYEEWKEMDDKNFLFSLYHNDLIKVKAKKNMKLSVNIKGSTLPKEMYGNDLFFYYTNADIATASIRVENHDNSYCVRGMGIKTLVSIEKYTVDAIGNIHKVPKEPRQTFDRKAR